MAALLRGWRERRVSQLELVLRLAEHLDVPMRERNALLLAAGYAPRFKETPLDDPSLGVLREGLETLLRGYEPYPAFIVDATFNVIAANGGIALLMSSAPAHLLTEPLNAMRLTLHPEGLAPRIRNLREWRGHLLAQMEQQIALTGPGPLRELYEEVSAFPLPPGRPAGDEPLAPLLPYFALPMVIEHEGRVSSFVSSLSTFNTPLDVTVAELAVETLLPAVLGSSQANSATKLSTVQVRLTSITVRTPSAGGLLRAASAATAAA